MSGEAPQCSSIPSPESPSTWKELNAGAPVGVICCPNRTIHNYLMCHKFYFFFFIFILFPTSHTWYKIDPKRTKRWMTFSAATASFFKVILKIHFLLSYCFVKFLKYCICSYQDFNWCLEQISSHPLNPNSSI